MTIRHRAFRAGLFLTAVAGALAGALVNATPAAAEGMYVMYKNGLSGKCLDVLDFSVENGGNVGQWDCWAGPPQLWLKEPSERYKGWFKLKNKHSGKCLEVTGFSTVDGGNVAQFDCWDGPHQVWQVLMVPTVNNDPRFHFDAPLLINFNSGKCLEVADFSQENGGNVQQFNCWRQVAMSFQVWTEASPYRPR